jgi:hypothetical protein
VSLRLAGPVGSGGLQADGDLRVLPGSAILVMADGIRGISVGGDFENFGTIRFTDGCGCQNGGYFSLTGTDAHHVNGGTLDLRASIVAVMNPGSTFTNTGAISVTGPHPSLFALFSGPTRVGSFEMQGGSITGTETIQVVNFAPYRPDNWTFIWSGGTIGTVPGDSVRSVLLVTELDVTLAHVALVGRLDLLGTRDWNPTLIDGDVGPGVELQLASTWDHSIEFTSAAGIVVNEGAIHAEALRGSGAYTLHFPGLINAGRLTTSLAGAVSLSLDSLVNTGTIDAESDLILTTAGGLLRNNGTITMRSGALRMAGSTTFDAGVGSVMTGTLALDGGTLQGDGAVGDVVSTGGSIRPGAPIGTLQAASLTLDAGSSVTIDIADAVAGSHDQLAVEGQIAYAGKLSITSIAPFIGDMCGRVVTIIADGATGVRGAFARIFGLQQGPTRQWRVHNPANLYQLVGFNPIPNIFATPAAVTATEGAATGSYAVCLGQHAPTADVTVTTARGGSEIEVFPRTLTFTPVNWMLPQFVTVVAINDGDAEGPHTDVVNHTITTTDPLYATSVFLGTIDVSIIDDEASAVAIATRGTAGSGAPPASR